MNKHIFSIMLFAIVASMALSSCGRRNGRNRRNNNSTEVSATNRRNKVDNTERTKITQNPSRNRSKMDGATIFKKCGGAVFMIFTSDGQNSFQGSGFFINPEGLAVSNYHVFQGTYRGMEMIKLPGSDQAFKVKNVIANSKDNDYILFQVDINGSVPYIPIANSRPNVGDKVFAIGSPRGLENTFSSGEVSGWRDTYLMQINAQIDHGSSGGALINEYGEVVGITSGSFCDGSQANLNYAWSIDALKKYFK